MPSLDELPRDRLAVRMVDLMTGDYGRDFEARALMTNLARLVDRSIVRYREASDCFDEWLETRHLGNESSRFRGVSALEECITLTYRALRHGEELVGRGILDPSLMPSEAAKTSLTDMRHASQHTEDRILGRRRPPITQGEYFFPTFGEAVVQLGSQSLSYRSLAETITALHEAVGSPAG